MGHAEPGELAEFGHMGTAATQVPVLGTVVPVQMYRRRQVEFFGMDWCLKNRVDSVWILGDFA